MALRVLGIETSCDETAASMVEEGGRVLSNVVNSQVDLHRRFRGIVPELASRAHLQKIAGVIERALEEAGGRGPDAVAFTQGPGLLGPLLVGKVAAVTLARLRGLPIIGVNHLEGHVFAAGIEEPLRFPALALIVSGGHTDLVLCPGPGRWRVLGRTRDDAAGEAFDKVARMLELGYPGGPIIDRLAREGDPAAVRFPRPLLEGSWDFSFAGLKTSVLYHLKDKGRLPRGKDLRGVCASFQEATVDALVWKAMRAAETFRPRSLVLGGGVAANSRLRDRFTTEGRRRGFAVLVPPPRLCTDNGAMIAQAALMRLKAGAKPGSLRSDPSLGFKNWRLPHARALPLKERGKGDGGRSRGRKTILSLLGLSLLGLAPARAQVGFEDSFYSARAMAMGGAFTAVPDDPVSLFYNPAFLGTNRHVGIDANALREFHAPMSSVDQGNLNAIVALPVTRPTYQGTFALAGLYNRQFGTGAERMESLGYGTHGLWDTEAGSFDTGASVAFAGQDFGGGTSVAVHPDLSWGGLYRFKNQYYGGVALSNIGGPRWSANGLAQEAPFTISAGASEVVSDFVLAADVRAIPKASGAPSSADAGTGFEYWWRDRQKRALALRAGLRLANDDSTGDWGLGVKIFGGELDYAMSVPFQGTWRLGNALSFLVRFGEGDPGAAYERLFEQDLRYRQQLTRDLDAQEIRAWRLESELQKRRAEIESLKSELDSKTVSAAKAQERLSHLEGRTKDDASELRRLRGDEAALRDKLKEQARMIGGKTRRILFEQDMETYRKLKLSGAPKPVLVNALKQIVETYKDSGVDLSGANEELLRLLRE